MGKRKHLDPLIRLAGQINNFIFQQYQEYILSYYHVCIIKPFANIAAMTILYQTSNILEMGKYFYTYNHKAIINDYTVELIKVIKMYYMFA